MNRMRTSLAALSLLLIGALTGCSDAEVASNNLSVDADNFRVPRRVVFFNGITDKIILTIEGNCSLQPDQANRKVDAICKLPDGTFIKHSEGLSDNVTYVSQQLTGVNVDTMQYALIFKPEAIVPDFQRPAGAK